MWRSQSELFELRTILHWKPPHVQWVWTLCLMHAAGKLGLTLQVDLECRVHDESVSHPLSRGCSWRIGWMSGMEKSWFGCRLAK